MGYIGNEPAEKYSALTQQTFSTPTGTSFTLSTSVTNSKDIALFIDNVRQDPASYTASGTTLTTSTIASPSTMYCLFNGRSTHTISPPANSVGLTELAGGTDGNIISFDASGNPVAIATGSSGQVLTSGGAGAAPSFAAAAGGKVVQVVNVQDSAVATTTTVMPGDDTIPQITEGAEIMTLAITPTSSSNKLFIEVVFHIGHSAAHWLTCALFNTDSHSTNALAAAIGFSHSTTGTTENQSFNYYMTAPSTSSTTFRVRTGSAAAGTTTFNGTAGSRLMGGVIASSITITEIAV